MASNRAELKIFGTNDFSDIFALDLLIEKNAYLLLFQENEYLQYTFPTKYLFSTQFLD
jgi:hypothetical protein